ncbi:MAG TPA: DUF4148 domain-containing protein [Noviherbaspirillum sp.]|nr:DUF4148 domain-containing protein [Noviherbaspirillum sp.]
MNAKNLIAAAAVFAITGSAFAQASSEYVEFTNVVSTKSRAEVQAELAQANAQARLAGNTEYVEFGKLASATPRAQVRAELASAHATVGSSPEYVEFKNVASSKTRAEVRNEVLQAAGGAHQAIGG